MTGDDEALLAALLDGDHRALARVISRIEDRAPGHRELVSALYEHTGDAEVIGITGSPGAGKSTLVDKLAERYRERGETVGVIAIDPSSPYTGGAVLGDRIRMASTVGDMDVFVRSMSARGSLGGLSTATADAVKAMDAFGKDRIVVETVGAGQNEIDVVRAADTVAVLVPPGSGDTVQTLKAGILEIADVFVVNKADRPGADRTVQELSEMIELGHGSAAGSTGHHGPGSAGHHGVGDGGDSHGSATGSTGHYVEDEGHHGPESAGHDDTDGPWLPPIVETVATDGEGVDELIDAFGIHRAHLERSGALAERRRRRYVEEITTLLREDVHGLLEAELDRAGGLEALAEAVRLGETDPYTVADDALAPVEECLADLETGSQ